MQQSSSAQMPTSSIQSLRIRTNRRNGHSIFVEDSRHAPHAIATPAPQPANALQRFGMDPASFAAMQTITQQIPQPQFNHGGLNGKDLEVLAKKLSQF